MISLPAQSPPALRPERALFARPLVGMECLKSFLGLEERAVRAEIAAGRLKWAFDLRANGEKQFLRVLSLSMLCWKCPEIRQPDDIEAVADLILPGASRETGVVRGTTLQDCFNVVSGHIRHLVRRKKLKLADRRRPDWRRQNLLSPVVTRASVVELLRTSRAELLENLNFNAPAARARRGLAQRRTRFRPVSDYLRPDDAGHSHHRPAELASMQAEE